MNAFELTPKPWLIIAAVVIICFLMIGVWRNVLHQKGAADWDGRFGRLVKPASFGLFFIFGICVVPLMVHAFVVLQNQGSGYEWLKANGMAIVYVMWGVFLVGLGLPVLMMSRQGFFAPATPVKS